MTMKHLVSLESNAAVWPAAWRMVLIALCTLILCSCRAPAHARRGDCPESRTGDEGAAAYAQQPQEPWSPPGIERPWPKDEYLRDGGDQGPSAGVRNKREVVGVGMEDTVAHYDTLDGRTLVEPSNEVHLYSPRFGAVRQVVALAAGEERQRPADVRDPRKAAIPVSAEITAGVKQHIPIDNKISARPAIVMRTKQGQGAMSDAVPLQAFQNGFKAYENLAIIRKGVYENSETLFLARSARAAIAWSHDQAVQVILDLNGPNAAVKYDAAQTTYTVEEPPGDPRLRLVKVASTSAARPGETVDFTLRFDNIGNQPLGHVTILDSLSTRLEFVPEGAQCSVAAKISSFPNEGESVVVRCELSEPLKPGRGGILRFRCRVR
jgi:uncharacterized repeat protein (TIGR01451 family)